MKKKSKNSLLKRVSGTAGIVVVLMALSTAIAAAVPFQIGNVFAGTGNGKIDVYYPNGTFIQTLETTSGSSEQTGMCFDASENLYATSWTAGTMSKFNNTGGLLMYPWGGPFSVHPETCVVDSAGNIYVGEVDGANNIRKFNASGGLLGNWSPTTESRGIDWIDLAADQSTIFYTSEGSSVKRFSVSNTTQLSDFATGLSAPCYALRIRPNGEVMVACSSQVYLLNATGSPIQNYTTASVGEPSFFFALNLDPDGKSFWTGGYSTGNIYRINITDGSLLTNFTAPPRVFSMAGLAVFGEITVGAPPSAKGNITGGGWIISPNIPTAKTNKATFGFVAHYADGATTPSGSLQFTDHVSGMDVHGNVTTLSVDKTLMNATFTGTATINGAGAYAYTVKVHDGGEPGKIVDNFEISIPGFMAGYSASGALMGGNIQIHDP